MTNATTDFYFIVYRIRMSYVNLFNTAVANDQQNPQNHRNCLELWRPPPDPLAGFNGFPRGNGTEGRERKGEKERGRMDTLFLRRGCASTTNSNLM